MSDRRREVLLAALDLAGRDPAGQLPFERVPGATEIFLDRDALVLALQHRWTTLLTGRIELAMLDEAPVDAVGVAWRGLASDEPVLRRVLDDHLHDRAAIAYEHRLLALWSGLADPDEPAAEITRIGAAFAALLRAPLAVPRRGVATYA